MGVVGETVDAAKALLATERGRAARAVVTGAVIVAAPIVMRLPFVRRHPVGRVLAIVGGAALVIRAAEAMRDWEPKLGAA